MGYYGILWVADYAKCDVEGRPSAFVDGLSQGRWGCACAFLECRGGAIYNYQAKGARGDE